MTYPIFCLLPVPAKSKEVRPEKARFIPINDKTLPQLHTYQHYRSEFILEMTRFDFASVSFCRFLYALKKAANNPPKRNKYRNIFQPARRCCAAANAIAGA